MAYVPPTSLNLLRFPPIACPQHCKFPPPLTTVSPFRYCYLLPSLFSPFSDSLIHLPQSSFRLPSHLHLTMTVEKISTLVPTPLTIGVVGFGNFGQFLAKTFAAQGHRYVFSCSSYFLSYHSLFPALLADLSSYSVPCQFFSIHSYFMLILTALLVVAAAIIMLPLLQLVVNMFVVTML